MVVVLVGESKKAYSTKETKENERKRQRYRDREISM
jgi:hypothetical protein